MTEFILHAGFHKTGSSSIQHTLAHLPMDGTEYLDWGHINHSMPFLAAFTNGELTEMGQTARAPVTPEGKAALKKLNDGLESAGADRVILSAESFSVAGYRAGLVALRDKLLRHGTIRVIAYVRPFQSLVASDFQQCARAGLQVKFGRSPDYLQRMRMLDDVFGPENVQFLIFSKDTLIEGDVVCDFATRLGIDLPKDAIKRVNESVSLECVAAARCAALYGEVGVGRDVDLELNYFATNQLRLLGNTKFKIASKVLKKLEEPYRDELARVQRRIGGCFPPMPAQEGGIWSDEDLFRIAGCCQDRLIEIVERFASRTKGAPAIIEAALSALAEEPRPEIRVAKLVDTIKRIRLSEKALKRAA